MPLLVVSGVKPTSIAPRVQYAKSPFLVGALHEVQIGQVAVLSCSEKSESLTDQDGFPRLTLLSSGWVATAQTKGERNHRVKGEQREI